MPDSPSTDSPSPIQISLGRIQKLEEEFRKHKNFWDGQASYMRLVMEASQSLTQGLVKAVGALDRRQGQAIQELSKRIDTLVAQVATAAASKTTPKDKAPLATDTASGTSEQAELFDALMNRLNDVHTQITEIKQGQSHIQTLYETLEQRLNAQDGTLATMPTMDQMIALLSPTSEPSPPSEPDA